MHGLIFLLQVFSHVGFHLKDFIKNGRMFMAALGIYVLVWK